MQKTEHDNAPQVHLRIVKEHETRLQKARAHLLALGTVVNTTFVGQAAQIAFNRGNGVDKFSFPFFHNLPIQGAWEATQGAIFISAAGTLVTALIKPSTNKKRDLATIFSSVAFAASNSALDAIISTPMPEQMKFAPYLGAAIVTSFAGMFFALRRGRRKEEKPDQNQIDFEVG